MEKMKKMKETLCPDLKPCQDGAHVSDSQTDIKGPLKVLLNVRTGQNTHTQTQWHTGLDGRIMICMGTRAAKRSAICQLEGRGRDTRSHQGSGWAEKRRRGAVSPNRRRVKVRRPRSCRRHASTPKGKKRWCMVFFSEVISERWG